MNHMGTVKIETKRLLLIKISSVRQYYYFNKMEVL